MFKFPKRHNKGFTLIELLVVIAIIGILASVVIASLADARKGARDAKRLSDIKQLQNALELFRNANGGLYPTDSPDTTVSNMTSGTYDITPYISIPTDPTNTGSNGYRYRVNGASRTSYTMLFRFETSRTNMYNENIATWCSVTGGSGYGYSGWNGMDGSNGANNSSNWPQCF